MNSITSNQNFLIATTENNIFNHDNPYTIYALNCDKAVEKTHEIDENKAQNVSNNIIIAAENGCKNILKPNCGEDTLFIENTNIKSVNNEKGLDNNNNVTYQNGNSCGSHDEVNCLINCVCMIE
ncbi:unnamed protein product [Gordionus sp. m RMFG-2023]